jgi:hypothetical protein
VHFLVEPPRIGALAKANKLNRCWGWEQAGPISQGSVCHMGQPDDAFWHDGGGG